MSAAGAVVLHESSASGGASLGAVAVAADGVEEIGAAEFVFVLVVFVGALAAFAGPQFWLVFLYGFRFLGVEGEFVDVPVLCDVPVLFEFEGLREVVYFLGLYAVEDAGVPASVGVAVEEQAGVVGGWGEMQELGAAVGTYGSCVGVCRSCRAAVLPLFRRVRGLVW